MILGVRAHVGTRGSRCEVGVRTSRRPGASACVLGGSGGAGSKQGRARIPGARVLGQEAIWAVRGWKGDGTGSLVGHGLAGGERADWALAHAGRSG